MVRIPTAFSLAGQRIEVVWCDGLVDENDNVGEACYRRNQIRIQRQVDGVFERPVSQMEQTFLHELLHWIFYLLGEHELRRNEKLVDQVAWLLHQALTTGEA